MCDPDCSLLPGLCLFFGDVGSTKFSVNKMEHKRYGKKTYKNHNKNNSAWCNRFYIIRDRGKKKEKEKTEHAQAKKELQKLFL